MGGHLPRPVRVSREMGQRGEVGVKEERERRGGEGVRGDGDQEQLCNHHHVSALTD